MASKYNLGETLSSLFALKKEGGLTTEQYEQIKLSFIRDLDAPSGSASTPSASTQAPIPAPVQSEAAAPVPLSKAEKKRQKKAAAAAAAASSTPTEVPSPVAPVATVAATTPAPAPAAAVEVAAPEKKGKKEKKRGPKRAMSAFFQYTGEVRQEFSKKHPELSFTELGKMLGQEWRNMTDAQKAPYVALAKVDMDRYIKECEEQGIPTTAGKDKTAAKKADGNGAERKRGRESDKLSTTPQSAPSQQRKSGGAPAPVMGRSPHLRFLASDSDSDSD